MSAAISGESFVSYLKFDRKSSKIDVVYFHQFANQVSQKIGLTISSQCKSRFVWKFLEWILARLVRQWRQTGSCRLFNAS